jgi:hypothetical protein
MVRFFEEFGVKVAMGSSSSQQTFKLLWRLQVAHCHLQSCCISMRWRNPLVLQLLNGRNAWAPGIMMQNLHLLQVVLDAGSSSFGTVLQHFC